jgi:RNA polymerase-binding transcription factor DksA
MPRATKDAPAKAAGKKATAKRAGAKADRSDRAAKSNSRSDAKVSKSAKSAKVTKVTKVAAKATDKKAAPRRSGTRKKVVLDRFLEGQLADLEVERENYLRQAESLQAEADALTEDREPGDVQFDEESGEGDTLAVERERDLALSAQARGAIEQIDTAIAKIRAGTYGKCENCGTSIPKERLKALPYAALCVKCKSGGLGLR